MHELVRSIRNARYQSGSIAFARAFALPFRAARFLTRHRSLWSLVAIPALINLTLFAVATGLVVAHADAAVALIWTPAPGNSLWAIVLLVLWYVLYGVVIVFGLMAAYVITLLLSGVVASPFNDALSVRVEQRLTSRDAPQSSVSFFREVIYSVVSTAGVLLLYAASMVPVLLLNLVPGVGSVAAAGLGAGLGAFFLALEFTDAPLARRGYTLRQKLHLLRAHPGSTIGFGLGTTVLLWIPFLNVLCVPIAVVGGTVLALGLTAERGDG